MGNSGSQKVTQKTETNPYDGLPSWATDYYKSDIKAGEKLMTDAAAVRDWMAANPEQILGLSDNEYNALETILGGAAGATDYIGKAERAMSGDQYRDPYLDNVVDTTLEGIRREAQREQVARGSSEASFGGLNGTRAAVADALAQELTGKTMASTEAQLRSDAERFAAEMGLSSSQVLAGLGQQYFDIAKDTGAAQGSVGALERELEQAQLTANRTNQQQAIDWYTSIFNSTRQLPSTMGGTTSGASTQPGPSPLAQGLGTAASAAALWTAISDERVKENVEPVQNALDKLRKLEAYEYDYIDGIDQPAGRHTGLMAQDIEKADIKGGTFDGEDHIKRVQPYSVLATVVQAVKELDARTMPEAA